MHHIFLTNHTTDREKERLNPKLHNRKEAARNFPCHLPPTTMPRHSAFSRFRARYMGESFTLHYLKVLRELLAFIVFSYTVLLGALVLAAWTTYFLVAK